MPIGSFTRAALPDVSMYGSRRMPIWLMPRICWPAVDAVTRPILVVTRETKRQGRIVPSAMADCMAYYLFRRQNPELHRVHQLVHFGRERGERARDVVDAQGDLGQGVFGRRRVGLSIAGS